MNTPHAHQPRTAKAGILQDNPDDLALAVRNLVVASGLISDDEFENAVALRVPGIPPAAHVVLKAWRDPDFKARLLDDPHGACAEAGYPVPTTAPRVGFFANTPDTHHVVVCTLCSCHSRPLLGVPPAWYKTHEYRARTVREPRAVLAEFGTTIPDHVTVRVHDASADLRYLVLPLAPANLATSSNADLLQRITAESLFGVRHVEGFSHQ